MKFLRVSATLACAGILLSSGAFAGFIEDNQFLAQRSAWSETTAGGADPQGWWAVGNSRVFGIVGPDLAEAQIHQITGPHIMLAGTMANASAFGPAKLNLTVAGQPVTFTKMTLSKVRLTGIVVMELVSPDLTMTVVNYTPFDLDAMLRTVIIKSTGSAPLDNVVLTATIGRTVVQDGRLFDSWKGSTDGNAMGQTRQLFSSFIEGAEAASTPDKTGTLTVKIGLIPAGGETVRTQFLAFSMKEVGDEADTIGRIRAYGTKLLVQTYADWNNWMAGTTRLACPDQKLADLLDDTKVLVKLQTAEPQGAAGPMEFFAGVWVRDSCGPFRYYLRMGNFEAAKKMLEFYYRGTAYNKSVSNFKPMDMDLSTPIPADLDWSSIPTDRVETPSWLILQHAWYYHFTGDLEPIRAHWPYLKRCLMGQLIDEKGQPFTTINYGGIELKPNKEYRFIHHGDETWIYPGFEVLNSAVFPEPNDHVHWDEYSTDSTWEFVSSAEALADFAKRLGKTSEAAELGKIAKDSRAALERDYWMKERGIYAPAMDMRSHDIHQPPFTMVNLNPLWIGYLKGDDPKAVSNVLETMKYTMNPNYLTDATETLRVYVGMQPGLFLYNLAAIDHPFGDDALKAMVEVASATGEYTEKEVTDPKGYATQFWGHRIRPWEGGINADAAFFYLTGLVPDLGNGKISLEPRLPLGWKEMSVTNQALGDGRLDVGVTDTGSRRTYAIKWTGSKPLTTDFKISLPQARISSVSLNGASVKVASKTRWGMTVGALSLNLAPGKVATIIADYKQQAAEPYKFARKKYQYIVPKKEPYHDVVLWSYEPRKQKPEDPAPYDIIKAKWKVRLVSPMTPTSPAWLRPLLLTSTGKPNCKVFFMGPGSVTNSLKYQKFWGNPELTKLFTDFMNAGGAIVEVKGGATTSDWFGKLFGEANYFTVPTAATPIVPVGASGKLVCDLLGLSETTDKKAMGSGMFVYKKMAVFARPEPETTSGSILAKRFGKGFFMSLFVDADIQRVGALGIKLGDPDVLSAIYKSIGAAQVSSVEGAFEDYGKNGSFSDDFKGLAEGSSGTPRWLPLTGIWKIQNGEYHELNGNGYDFCTTANAKTRGDYSVEIVSKLVEGINEAGVVVNLPSRFTTSNSEMMRFCGGSTLWCGPIQGGFSLDHEVQTGLPHEGTDFHTMTVNVYNSRGTYSILIDGKEVAKDFKLKVIPKSPDEPVYIGLISCRGHVAYKSVKVTPLT